MGGISVLVVLGLFMSFYAVYLFLIFISIFYLVENYIFESLFLYNKTCGHIPREALTLQHEVGIRQCPGGAGTGIYQELYGVNQSAV